jgi:hypothetical protein
LFGGAAYWGITNPKEPAPGYTHALFYKGGGAIYLNDLQFEILTGACFIITISIFVSLFAGTLGVGPADSFSTKRALVLGNPNNSKNDSGP